MWHPGANQEGRLILLTSDNSLRIFNMDHETSVDPEHTWILSDHRRQDNSKGFFGESAMSLKGSLGETAVSFAFAPSVGNDPDPHLWPLFILCGDGSVFCMVTSSLNQNQKPKLMGPLSMYPESDDNYGTDACSILCLHPKISSPPILIIATNHGILYHCIVLQKLDGDEHEDCHDNVSQISQSDWSTLTMRSSVDLALHVYESIELELNLVSSESPQVSGLSIELV